MTIAPFTLVIVGMWAAAALLEYAEFLYYWQLKEYRFDRFRDFLQTLEGRKVWWRLTLAWRLPAIIFLTLLPFNYTFGRYIAFGVALADIIWLLTRLLTHRLPRPVLTVKAVAVLGGSLIFDAVIAYLSHEWVLVVAFAMVRVVTVGVVVGMVNVPATLTKKAILILAAKKLAKYGDLLVIGITGSYGKSSTKEFLDNILSHKFRVIRTPKNINTEIGVAQFILKQTFQDKDIFLVEMDAYSLGENTTMCKMVRPKMGILTSINEQHLSLTGSIQNTQTANYELLHALPKDGLAVINNDNALCREPIPTLSCRVETFGAEESFKPTCLIRAAEPGPKGMRVAFSLQGKPVEGVAPIIGAHHAHNIAPCLLIGQALGISLPQMQEALSGLRLPVHGMKLRSYGSTTIIDDSYNSNPNGFAAAGIWTVFASLA
jgi:UDP-N-acetylmuramoyl-tripeptide--D-alanyl-D-alanine ligase